MKRIIFLLVLFHLQNINYAQKSPFVGEIINSVNIDTLTNHVNILSGESPFYNNFIQYNIQSRYIFQPGNGYAEKFISGELHKYQLNTIDQPVLFYAKNIYAVQNGSDNTKIIIICAHFDSIVSAVDSMNAVAPGADDNASGVAAVLECARLLSKYKTTYKIVYAFWDAEEIGWRGSRFFADSAAHNNENILGVINLDMIGWDAANDSLIEIHANDTTGIYSPNLPEFISSVNENYKIGLKPRVFNPGSNRSDQYSFWLNNFNAVFLNEGLYTGDFNNYYHSKNDKIEYFNMDYFHRASQLAIASVASLAEIQGPAEIIPDEYFITQNYPNPFNSQTNITYSLPADNFVEIKIYNILGQVINTLVSDFQTAGNYTVIFNGNNLTSGVYFYTIRAGSYNTSKKMIYLK